MKYKLALLVFIAGVITIFLSGYLPEILFKHNIDAMINYRKYSSIIGYLLGLIYIVILFKYSQSNWIKAIAVIGVFSSMLVIPYNFINFRTEPFNGGINNYEIIQFITSAMLTFAVINLFIATVLLFIRNVRLSVRILLFITMLFGLLSTPFTSHMAFQYLVRRYDTTVVFKYLQFLSIVGFIMFFGRVYITFALVEDSEKSNFKESNKVITQNVFQ